MIVEQYSLKYEHKIIITDDEGKICNQNDLEEPLYFKFTIADLNTPAAYCINSIFESAKQQVLSREDKEPKVVVNVRR